MVQFTTLFLFILGLLPETLCSLTLEAETGDKVTICCQHELKHSDKIFWFKHTSDSVPLLLGCKQFYTSSPSETCYFFTESERIVMSVNEKNTSLTITAVNVSDTGLYYCSYRKLDVMIFSNSTSLQVKGENKTLLEISEKEEKKSVSENLGKAKDSRAVLFTLTLGFGAVSVILLIVLIFIILKHRKTYRGDITDKQDNEEKEPESMNYAGLQFTNKKTKSTGGDGEIVDSYSLYSVIQQ